MVKKRARDDARTGNWKCEMESDIIEFLFDKLRTVFPEFVYHRDSPYRWDFLIQIDGYKDGKYHRDNPSVMIQVKTGHLLQKKGRTDTWAALASNGPRDSFAEAYGLNGIFVLGVVIECTNDRGFSIQSLVYDLSGEERNIAMIPKRPLETNPFLNLIHVVDGDLERQLKDFVLEAVKKMGFDTTGRHYALLAGDRRNEIERAGKEMLKMAGGDRIENNHVDGAIFDCHIAIKTEKLKAQQKVMRINGLSQNNSENLRDGLGQFYANSYICMSRKRGRPPYTTENVDVFVLFFRLYQNVRSESMDTMFWKCRCAIVRTTEMIAEGIDLNSNISVSTIPGGKNYWIFERSFLLEKSHFPESI